MTTKLANSGRYDSFSHYKYIIMVA